MQEGIDVQCEVRTDFCGRVCGQAHVVWHSVLLLVANSKSSRVTMSMGETKEGLAEGMKENGE